jgi:2-octaprenyl-6-methoxyphenol hydroxylase
LIEPGTIAIIGGGPIGCALAAALYEHGVPCTVLEAREPPAASGDGRTLALTYGSRLILERIGAWSATDPVTPIKSIHVSQRGGFGRALLTAEDVHLEALGYVAPFAAVHRALLSRLDASRIDVRYGTRVSALQRDGDSVSLNCSSGDGEREFRVRLVVIADGGAALGEHVGARYVTHDYRQAAVVAMTKTSQPHGHCAYERFTPHGPAALLPAGDEFALVWSCPPDVAPTLLGDSDGQFLERLQQHFGDRAGRFLAVRNRAAFPLTLRFARQTVHPRAVLIGNSAQMLHPIAGQGFNLGLRDTWALADLLGRARASDPGAADLLGRYERARRADRLAGIAATDLLTRLFSNSFPLIEQARGLGIAALDLASPAKRFLMRRMIFGSLA